MPDLWRVTEVIDTTDESGRIEAWQIRLTRQTDGISLAMFLPKSSVESTAVAHGLTSADEAIEVLMHRAVRAVYEPDPDETNPWQLDGEQARAQALALVEHCKSTHAVVETAAPRRRTAAARAADILAPLRHVGIDPVKVAAARLERQRALARQGA